MSLSRHLLFGCAAVILAACLVVQAQAAILYLKGDVASTPVHAVAGTTIMPHKGGGIFYKLPFDFTAVTPRQNYILQPHIPAGNRLLFTEAVGYPVFTGKNNNADVMVEQVAAASVDPKQKLAGNWRVIHIFGKNVVGKRPLDINITANGGIGGHSGCNGFSGGFKVEGEKISFGRIAATLKACRGDLMRQEYALYDAFSKAVRYRNEQKKLVLLDKKGKPVLVFVRL